MFIYIYVFPLLMPKTSPIPHKRQICLSVNAELVKVAQEKGINISLLLDGALERELNPTSKEAYLNAIKFKNKLYKEYLDTRGLERDFDEKVYGENKNVVEEKKCTQEDREDKGNIERI